MIKFLIVVFLGVALIPGIPFVYGKYVEWDVSSSQYDSSSINTVFDSATPAVPPTTTRQAKDVNPATIIIDIRDSKFFNREHVINSINIMQPDFVEEFAILNPDKDLTVYVYDDNKDDSAAVVVRYLRHLGYTKSFVMQGGIEGWKKVGYETVIDKYAP